MMMSEMVVMSAALQAVVAGGVDVAVVDAAPTAVVVVEGREAGDPAGEGVAVGVILVEGMMLVAMEVMVVAAAVRATPVGTSVTEVVVVVVVVMSAVRVVGMVVSPAVSDCR